MHQFRLAAKEKSNWKFNIHSKTIMTKFQVLNTLTNIPFVGILGDDFLHSQKARIDYSTSIISLSSIPFEIPLLRNILQRSISTIRINPRTETIVPVKLLNPHKIKEGIIWSQQLNSNNTLLWDRQLRERVQDSPWCSTAGVPSRIT